MLNTSRKSFSHLTLSRPAEMTSSELKALWNQDQDQDKKHFNYRQAASLFCSK